MKEQKNIYFDRIEDSTTIKITWKPFSTYGVFLFLFALIVAFCFGLYWFGAIGIPLLFTNAIIYFFMSSDVRSEISAAQSDNCVSASGSKYSFTNPLTITIFKKQSGNDKDPNLIDSNESKPETTQDIEPAKQVPKSRPIVKIILVDFFLILSVFISFALISSFISGVTAPYGPGGEVLMTVLIMAIPFIVIAIICLKIRKKY